MAGRQRGAAALTVLCMMMAVIALSLGLMHFVRSGQQNNADYVRETRLRLAAESIVEAAALTVEQEPSIAEKWKADTAANINLETIHLSAVKPPAGVEWKVCGMKREDKIYLIGYARNLQNPSPWEECRLAKGELQKAGDGYVWLGWVP